MKKYGLQLRVPPSQKKQPVTRPLLSTAPIFRDDDDDDVEKEIIRQGSKNKALKEIEEQHKKALEEDPSAFSYDDVYDDMKQKAVLPRIQDQEERKPRYIQHLMQQAERRKKEQEVVYERKLAKERSQDEHLYADKDKYITSAYRRKLEEQQKWMEEERLRELREEKDDVTKKKDLSDFYFNLGKNVAFGAKEAEAREAKRLEEQKGEKLEAEKKLEEHRKEKEREEKKTDALGKDPSPEPAIAHPESSSAGNTSSRARRSIEPRDTEQASESKSTLDAATERKDSAVTEPGNEGPNPSNHHKRSEDAIAAAKERFMARKKAKVQY